MLDKTMTVEEAAGGVTLMMGAALAPTSNNVFTQTPEQREACIESYSILCYHAGITKNKLMSLLAPYEIPDTVEELYKNLYTGNSSEESEGDDG